MKTFKIDDSTIIFNTGGQVIVAFRDFNANLVFFDHTRSIVGRIDCTWNGTPVAYAVLERYVNGAYTVESSLTWRRFLGELADLHFDKVTK